MVEVSDISNHHKQDVKCKYLREVLLAARSCSGMHPHCRVVCHVGRLTIVIATSHAGAQPIFDQIQREENVSHQVRDLKLMLTTGAYLPG